MAQQKFYIGSVVRLISNGFIKMTVEDIDTETDIISCVWFDFQGKLCRDKFDMITLVDASIPQEVQ